MLTLRQGALRIVRALLPIITLYIGKLIIDEVVLLAGTPHPNDTLRESGRSTPNVLRGGCHNNDMIETQSEFARVPLFML